MRRSPNRTQREGSGSLHCLCAAVRRANRLLSLRYEEALGPSGVTPSQFELLMTLRAMGTADQTALSKQIEADQTTLSRNLKHLLAVGWVERAKDERDARRMRYRVSEAGLTQLRGATRCWQQVHGEMETALGAPMSEMWPVLDRIMEAARRTGGTGQDYLPT